MSYAVRKDGRGFRAVLSPDDVMAGVEDFSPTAPPTGPTYLTELSAINARYSEDTRMLSVAFASASLVDGPEEDVRKVDIRDEMAELVAEHDQALAQLKQKYGVD